MSLMRNSKLLNKKLYQYLLPAVIMVFAMQFGSLIDGVILGNMISGEALAVSSLVSPVLYIIQLPGFALGIGGSIIMGIYLGKREVEKGSKALSVCLISGSIISLIIAVISPFVSRPLASLFTTSEMLDLGYNYVFGYMLTIPVLTIALIIAPVMTTDNNPNLSSALFIVANVFKIGSELLFIDVFKWGMFGAAISTSFGYLVSLVTIVFYIKSKKRMLKFSLKYTKDFFKHLKECIKASLSTILDFALLSVQLAVSNIIIAKLIPDTEQQIIFGIISTFTIGFDLFVGGILQLIPTLCTVCYGEEDYYSLKSITNRIYALTIIVTSVLTVILMIFPSFYCSIFGFEYSDSSGFLIMRVFLLSFIPLELNKFSQSYYPSIEKNTPSVITVVLREGVLIIPLSVVLLITNGLMGYSIAHVIAETLCLVITYAFILIYNKKNKKKYGIFMIPPYSMKDAYDVTIDNDINKVSVLSNEIATYCLNHGINNYDAQIISLAGEEITSNIINYGFKKGSNNTIDVNLKIVNDKLILRIRDDGQVFDPTKYESPQSENITSGIILIRRLLNKMSYMRVLSTNNTIMEINIGEEKGEKNGD